MKKIMGLLLTTLLVMSLFVGCGSKEKEAEPTGGNDSNQSSRGECRTCYE